MTPAEDGDSEAEGRAAGDPGGEQQRLREACGSRDDGAVDEVAEPGHEGIAGQEPQEAAGEHEPAADREPDADEQGDEDRGARRSDREPEERRQVRAVERDEARLDREADRQGGERLDRRAAEHQGRAGGGQARRREPQRPSVRRVGRVESRDLRLGGGEIELAGMDAPDHGRDRGQPREVGRPLPDEVEEGRRRLVVPRVARDRDHRERDGRLHPVDAERPRDLGDRGLDGSGLGAIGQHPHGDPHREAQDADGLGGRPGLSSYGVIDGAPPRRCRVLAVRRGAGPRPHGLGHRAMPGSTRSDGGHGAEYGPGFRRRLRKFTDGAGRSPVYGDRTCRR